MTAILLLTLAPLLGCKKDPEPDACATACLAMEAELTAAIGAAGGEVDSEAWQGMCADAPTDADCETCFAWFQSEYIASLGVGWDCGCGFDAEGVAECRQQTGVEQSDADAAIASCELACEEQGLPLAGE
jgi:hypothetical protein